MKLSSNSVNLKTDTENINNFYNNLILLLHSTNNNNSNKQTQKNSLLKI